MGEFGSGKTLSAVKQCFEILSTHPKAIFITNTEIKGIKNKVYYFGSAKELVKVMAEVITEKNTNGYVIMIDELHVVLSDLFNNSDPIFLTYLSQLRKLGIVIIGTAQLYNKCPRTVRDYLRLSGEIIFCKKIYKGITLNKYVDMETAQEKSNLNLSYSIKHWEWFFHTIELYEMYDTRAVVSQIKSLIKYDDKKGANQNGLSNYN